jgi:hypothetical protein
MNEEYLWDRTGHTDEEIKELEQVLSELKYQPQQLEIPAGVGKARSSWALRTLAIAATIAMLLLGAGLWRGRQGSVGHQAVNTAKVLPTVQNLNQETAANTGHSSEDLAPAFSSNSTARRHVAATHRTVTPRLARRAAPQPTANEVAEALAAKQQLMLALRVVSAKLTVAQRQTLGTTTANQIHNQHKIG